MLKGKILLHQYSTVLH